MTGTPRSYIYIFSQLLFLKIILYHLHVSRPAGVYYSWFVPVCARLGSFLRLT